MIDRHLRSVLGATADIEIDPGGTPRVAPRSEDECVLLLQTAGGEGWRVRIEGNASWIPADAPADLALTTRRLSGVTHLNPADLVVSALTGTPWDLLQRTLVDQGVWVPIDPPGANRTLGSVLAAGSSGPLRAGFGGPRDRVLGLQLVTGDGALVQSGGKVAKNVAGFDLAKLAVGSYGAFGLLTTAHLRLVAVPRADATLIVAGDRDSLIHCARSMLEAGHTPAALELLSPRAALRREWVLGIRLMGSDASVEAARAAASDVAAPLALVSLVARDAVELWRSAQTGVVAAPVTLRLGALPSSLEDALDTLAHHLDENSEDWITVSVATGVLRWSGNAPSDRLRLLRRVAAQQEMPMTLERGPWPVRASLGHFGAYRESVARLVGSLRQAFDPRGVVMAPIDAEP